MQNRKAQHTKNQFARRRTYAATASNDYFLQATKWLITKDHRFLYYAVFLYILISIFAYQSGFWLNFNISILSYTNIIDIFKMYIAPGLLGCFSIVIFVFVLNKEKKSKIEIPHTNIVAYIVLSVSIIGVFVYSSLNILSVTSLTIGFTSILLTLITTFSISTEKTRAKYCIFSVFIFIFPVISFHGGGLDALKIIKNKQYMYIDDMNTLLSARINEPLVKYIDCIGSKYIMTNKENTKLYIVDVNKLKTLPIKFHNYDKLVFWHLGDQ